MSEHTDAEEKQRDASGARFNAVSFVAIGLSVAALLVSVFEVQAVRDGERAQVWPYVHIAQSFSGEGYGLIAANKGIGPARVRSATLLLDGKSYDDLDEAIKATVGDEDAFSFELYRTSQLAPGVMSADENITLFAVPWEPRTRRLADAWSTRINVQVCYCSVYDECWVAELGEREPAPVDTCAEPQP